MEPGVVAHTVNHPGTQKADVYQPGLQREPTKRKKKKKKKKRKKTSRASVSICPRLFI
jgi:hypothetical protein